jgi:type IV secretory pathway TraG/TraD family ATPase VirD4
MIRDLLNMGRSKGVSVLIGIQSVEGIVDIYKQAATDDLLSQCAHKTFLRAGGPQTAEWAEKHFGKIRHMEQVYSESKSGDSSGWSVQYSLRERSLFLAAVFLDLPFPKKGGIYRAVCDVPAHGCVYIVERSFDQMLSWVVKPASDVPALDKRSDPKEQALKPWSIEEKLRFYARKPDPQKPKPPYLPPRRRRKPPEEPPQDNLL